MELVVKYILNGEETTVDGSSVSFGGEPKEIAYVVKGNTIDKKMRRGFEDYRKNIDKTHFDENWKTSVAFEGRRVGEKDFSFSVFDVSKEDIEKAKGQLNAKATITDRHLADELLERPQNNLMKGAFKFEKKPKEGDKDYFSGFNFIFNEGKWKLDDWDAINKGDIDWNKFSEVYNKINNVQPSETGVKHSEGKSAMELDFDFIRQMAERMDSNKKNGKYEKWNWKKQLDYKDLAAATMRHLLEIMEDRFEDDGRPYGHLEAIATNAMMINYNLKHANR